MIKIQQQQNCEDPTKHWRVTQVYQLLVLIQSFLFFLFKSFPGYKYKIWKFLSFFAVCIVTVGISDGLSRASGNVRAVSSHWKIWNFELKICI